jgi:DNA polymerase-3 subunit delta'
MAEALSKEGNILLKLLEEPPENTVLILIAENQEEILPTILSRCQLVKINKIDDAAVAQALLRKGVPQANTQHIAYLADGNFNDAMQLIDATISVETMRLTELLRYSIRLEEGANSGALVKWAEEMVKLAEKT